MPSPPYLPLLATTILSLSFLLQSYLYRVQTTLEPPRIVVVKLRGRLGNQLFQIAASAHLAPVLYLRDTYSRETNYSYLVPSIRNHTHLCSGSWLKVSHNTCGGLHIPRSGCVYVDGFFQCERWGGEKVARLVESWIGYQEACNEYKRLIKGVDTDVIAVHIRRGDYLKKFNRGYLEALPLSYYQRAFTYHGRNHTYMLFSDDVDWTVKHIAPLLNNFIMVSETHPLKSLVLMTMADGWVIANSTFSWWGAFLGRLRRRKIGLDTVVVAPRVWFGKRGGDVRGLIPHDWVRL